MNSRAGTPLQPLGEFKTAVRRAVENEQERQRQIRDERSRAGGGDGRGLAVTRAISHQ